MIFVKNPEQIRLMKTAGRITGEALALAGEAVREGVSTAQLDSIIRQDFRCRFPLIHGQLFQRGAEFALGICIIRHGGPVIVFLYRSANLLYGNTSSTDLIFNSGQPGIECFRLQGQFRLAQLDDAKFCVHTAAHTSCKTG